MADHVAIVGVAKSFDGVKVLDDMTLGIEAGALVAVLGASGSGKTTLLRLIAGFERVAAGTISIGGRIVANPRTHVNVEQRGIGYVAQEGALFPHLDVMGNVLFGLDRRARRDRARAGALLETVGLGAAYADRTPASLSGGEQQRVALARALARRPALVLLDEPFSALDAALRVETRDAMVAALASFGATALLVTHDQSEALSMASKVAVLRGGRLVQVAAPAELYRHPVDAALATFVGDAVLLDGELAGGEARSALGVLRVHALAPPGPVRVMLRPEQIRLVSEGGVPARVLGTVFHGHDASLRLELADGTEITARVAGHQAQATGAILSVGVEGEAVAYGCANVAHPHDEARSPDTAT